MDAPTESNSAMSKKEMAKMKQEGLLRNAYARIEFLEAELASLRAASQVTEWEIVEDVADAPVELHDHPVLTTDTIRPRPVKPIWQGRLSDIECISEPHTYSIVKIDCIESTAALQNPAASQNPAIHVPMLELSQQQFNERCKEKLDLLWESTDAHDMMIDTIIQALRDIAVNGRPAALDDLVKRR